MFITTSFTENNVARTGLSPTITIWEMSGIGTYIKKVDNEPMVETDHAGFYLYEFSDIDNTKAYTISTDGGAELNDFDRYSYGIITPKESVEPFVTF